MKTSSQTNHHIFVEELRRRILEGPGETPPTARQEAAKTAAGVSNVQDLTVTRCAKSGTPPTVLRTPR